MAREDDPMVEGQPPPDGPGSALDLETFVRQASDVLAREIDGESVLVDVQSGFYFGLDDVGTRIWAWIGSGTRLATVLEKILESYDADEDRARSDLVEFVGVLASHGLATVDPGR